MFCKGCIYDAGGVQMSGGPGQAFERLRLPSRSLAVRPAADLHRLNLVDMVTRTPAWQFPDQLDVEACTVRDRVD